MQALQNMGLHGMPMPLQHMHPYQHMSMVPAYAFSSDPSQLNPQQQQMLQALGTQTVDTRTLGKPRGAATGGRASSGRTRRGFAAECEGTVSFNECG